MLRLQLEETGHYLHKERGNLIVLPSVSTILNSYKPVKRKATYRLLSLDANLQTLNTYCLKKACTNYLNGYRGSPDNLNEEVWIGIPETIDEITKGCKILWNQRAYCQHKWENVLSKHSLEHNVLSLYDEGLKIGFGSTCDLIYLDPEGQFVLVEFVACKDILSINWPSKEMTCDDPHIAKVLGKGVIALKKIRTILGARVMAVEQVLGIKINVSRVIVSTENPKSQIQIFSFSRKDSEIDVISWNALLDKYIHVNPLFIVPRS